MNHAERVVGESLPIPNLQEFAGGKVPRFPTKSLQEQYQFISDFDHLKNQKKGSYVSLEVEVRWGPISPGVEWSASYNEDSPSNSYVCDNLRCNRKFFDGAYRYLKEPTSIGTKRQWVGELAEAGFYNTNEATTMYQNGFTAGWGWLTAVAVFGNIAQFFMNAVVNKNVSIVLNKVCHALATVASFWVGEMWLNREPEQDIDFTKTVQIGLLSICIFTIVMMFVGLKQQNGKKKWESLSLSTY